MRTPVSESRKLKGPTSGVGAGRVTAPEIVGRSGGPQVCAVRRVDRACRSPGSPACSQRIIPPGGRVRQWVPLDHVTGCNACPHR